MVMNLLKIKEAASLMKGVLVHTPTVRAHWLEKSKGGEVYLKLENLQITASFKSRGSLIKILQLTDAQKKKGIVAMSAGNHAQGVAYHAQRLHIPATIVMPITTPSAKVEKTESFGAKVIFYGNSVDESSLKAQELIENEGLTLIHPYDDEAVITGQGTVALEMLTDVPEIDTLIIPIGGGGLSAGMCIAAKAINPDIIIYGVQSSDCPVMAKILYPDRVFEDADPHLSPLAEGILVRNPGLITREILKKYLTDILIVGDDYIELAISRLVMEGKMLAEGAGGAGVAALLAHPELFKDKKVGIVVCGGNVDARLISSLLMRDLVHQGKLICLEIQIMDSPGVLARITKVIGDAGGNIFELIHQRHFSSITIKMTNIDIIIETRGMEHSAQIVKLLNEAGFPTFFKA